MSASCSTLPLEIYLRIVVYCDASEKPYTLPDVQLPRRVEGVRRLVEGQVGRQAKVLSYWSYTHRRYEILRDVAQLLQAEGCILTRCSQTPEYGTETTATEMQSATAADDRVVSAGELDFHHAKLCIYRCQLWVETVFVQLEPLDAQRDKREYDKLRSHVAYWLGNKHVGYELQDAVRIRSPFLTRMFDETRSTRLSDNQEKVQLLYYSNNSLTVREVLQSGFLLNHSVPGSVRPAAQSHDTAVAVSSDRTPPSSISVPHIVDSVSRQSSSLAGNATPAEKPCAPFVFTSTMLAPHVKKIPADATPQRVLLCEVAPGQPFMTDQCLTGEYQGKHKFPSVISASLQGYDSVYYIQTHKHKGSAHTEEVSEKDREHVAIVQVQVQHSHQALPRYLLSVIPSTTSLPLRTDFTSVQAATATLVHVPGTKARAAVAGDNKGRTDRMRWVPPPPPSPSPSSPSKPLKAIYGLSSKPTQGSSSTNDVGVMGRAVGSAGSSPCRISGASEKWCNEDNSTLQHPVAPAITAGGGGDTRYLRFGGGNGRRITWASMPTGIDHHVAHGNDVPAQSTPTACAARTITMATPARGSGMNSSGASRAHSTGYVGSRNAWPNDGGHCTGGRASSVPSVPRTYSPTAIRSSPSQLPTNANSFRATDGPAPSLPFEVSYPGHLIERGVLYQGFPRGGSAHRHATAQTLSSSHVGDMDARGRGVAAQRQVAVHSAPSPHSLLPSNHNTYSAGAMSGGVFLSPTHRSALPASSRRVPQFVSPAAPTSHSTVPPEGSDQFTCSIHPRQLQSLYCTACEELTCPYCASVGMHRTHVVVEAGEGAMTLHAEVEALREDLHTFLEKYKKMEGELRVERSHYTARQQQDLDFIQHHFTTLRQALHQAESAMMQRVQAAWCSPPLAETAAVIRKYTQALTPIDAVLRRYNGAAVADGASIGEEAPGGSEKRMFELLRFLRTTPSLVSEVRGSLDPQKKDDERRLHEAVVDYRKAIKTRETSFREVDWSGLGWLLEGIGSFPSSEAGIPPLERSAPAAPLYTGGVASPPGQIATAPSVRGTIDHHSNCARTRLQSRASMGRASPNTHSKADLFSLSADVLLRPASTPIEDGDALSTASLHRSTLSFAQRADRLRNRLTDVRRGYIWVIDNATKYFAPEQRKAVCSTRFHLLGVAWELRIASYPSDRHFESNSALTSFGLSGSEAGHEATAASRKTSLNSRKGDNVELKQITDEQVCASPLETDSDQGNMHTLTTDDASGTPVTVGPSPDEGEWLGLFLFPLQHCLRMDFRVIAFSDMTWADWQVTGWVPRFAGRGWGIYPFLSRRELMETKKLARNDTVKICITPISDLY